MVCLSKNKILGFICCAFWIIFFVGCESSLEESAPKEKIKKVEVFTVTPETFEETIIASAVASAHLEHRVSTEVSGLLKEKHAEWGDFVRKGDTLFEIDSEVFRLTIKEKTAALTRTQAKLEFIQASTKRKKPLLKANTLSQAAWDKLQFDLASAISEKNQAQVALEQSRRNLRLTVLKSPIDGMILEDYHDAGEVIPVGTVLARIADTAWITFDVGVSDLDLGYLHLGDVVPVTIDAFGDRRFEGKITRISGNASPTQGTFPIEVTLENPDRAILPGVVGRLQLSAEKHEDQIVIPMMSVHREGGSTYVFLVQKQQAIKKLVKLGKVLGERVLIQEGLKSGDALILIAQGRLKSGEQVEVIRPLSVSLKSK